MAKTKAELLGEAKELGLDVSDKNTVAEIKAAIESAGTQPDQKLAKAGKRSAKGLAEAEKKQEKVDKQKLSEETKEQPKAARKRPVKPARSRIERRAKGYKNSIKKIDKTKEYSLQDAAKLAVETSHVKFDATVELHVRLNVDPRQADQNLRDSIVLPAGTGKKVDVAVFAEDDDVKKAKEAGAVLASTDEVISALEKNQINFDVLIATPNLMAKLAKYARVLGPKGLMPNPKSGTVTKDVVQAIKQAKAGKIEYRVDSTGNIHVGTGKVSFGATKIESNLRAVLDSIRYNKPSSLKGNYLISITVTTTMGPPIRIKNSEL